MPKLFDVKVVKAKSYRGSYLTILTVMQCGILLIQKDGTYSIDISFSVWKYGIHLHLVNAKENRCREIKKVRKQ